MPPPLKLARQRLPARQEHDREDFTTAGSSKPFVIIEISAETERLP
jgi:hypothetical protein